jgi:hypothetical protein
MTTHEPIVQIHGEPVAQQKARALIGWLGHEEAIRLLLGRSPAPGEDVSQVEGTYEQLSSAVAGRGAFSASESPVESAKYWHLESLAESPLLRTTFASLDWSLRAVDLSRVIAYQKAIKVDGLDERVAPISADRSKLVEFCLPNEQPIAPQSVLGDIDQKGFTISSLNPNLRIAGTQVQQAQVAPELGLQPMSMLAITFLVSMGTSYLQVANYHGRDFLRDGYHRAAGLLRAGIAEVPCVYIKARNFDEIGANPATMLSYEVLFGERPPLLGDFWDDSVSAEIDQPTARKAVRVRGEEFNIQG